MLIQAFNCGPMDNGVYLVVDNATGTAAVIDPSFDAEPVADFAAERGFDIRWILNTHAHLDHVAGNHQFVERFGCSIAMHPADAPLLDRMREQAAMFGLPAFTPPTPDHWLENGVEFKFGDTKLQALLAPGHSPGSVVLLAEGHAFTGDVLFRGSIGRADLPGGDHHQLLATLRDVILPLPDETIVYPGHGPTTTIGAERRANPFLTTL